MTLYLSKVGKKAAIPDNVDDDDALDMFADNLDGDAKKTEKKAPIEETKDPVLLDDVNINNTMEIFLSFNICNLSYEGKLGVQVENRRCRTSWTTHKSKDA